MGRGTVKPVMTGSGHGMSRCFKPVMAGKELTVQRERKRERESSDLFTPQFVSPQKKVLTPPYEVTAKS